MIYEHVCGICQIHFDVSKDAEHYRRPEPCPQCGAQCARIPFPRRTYLANTAVQERYFSQALGQVVTRREELQIAKQQGMIEVGNEKIEKHVKTELHSYDDVWKGV